MTGIIKFNNGQLLINKKTTPLFEPYFHDHNKVPLFELNHEFDPINIYDKEVLQYFNSIKPNDNVESIVDWFSNLMTRSGITVFQGDACTGKSVFCEAINETYGTNNCILVPSTYRDPYYLRAINGEMYTNNRSNVCTLNEKIIFMCECENKIDFDYLKEIFPNKSVIIQSNDTVSYYKGNNKFIFNQKFDGENKDELIRLKIKDWKNSFIHLIAKNIHVYN